MNTILSTTRSIISNSLVENMLEETLWFLVAFIKKAGFILYLKITTIKGDADGQNPIVDDIAEGT